MSGGSQHNPNGRQSQLGSGWSPLQLQVANLLARAPQAHMASDRGVTWHTPTPPPHLYHVPAPSPPDPLQALKSSSNSVFRHTATPPELYRHTPTPPDKHHMRHTPSPGDIKNPALPPVDLYPHLGGGRDKLRTDDLLAYARVGVDLSLSSGRASNGAATSPAPPGAGGPPTPTGAPPSLSVRDAPTINSLIARAAPRPPHARVDALLERLAPAPASPHSVIVHSRVVPTPSPPSSADDEPDACAPPGAKRKRKPERVVRVPVPPPPSLAAVPAPAPVVTPEPAAAPAPVPLPAVAPRVSPPPADAEPKSIPMPAPPPPIENGDVAHVKTNGPDERPPSPRPDQPHARRKTRSGSAETIADIAAMIADTDRAAAAPLPPPPEPPAALSVDKLRSVLASPDAPRTEPVGAVEPSVPSTAEAAPAPAAVTPPSATAPPTPPAPPPAPAAAPRRRSARTSNPEAPNVPVESPSEAKPAEPEASDASTAEPAAASFVEVENQLEKMFAGLEEEPLADPLPTGSDVTDACGTADDAMRKRRRSAPARPDRRAPRAPRAGPPALSDDVPRKKQQKKKQDARRPRKGPRDASMKDAYDSGSNASSSKSRGPYIQIRGPRDSPLSVSVMNTSTGEEEDTGSRRKGGEEFRNGVRGVRAVRGLHASTLGLRYDATTPDVTWLCAFCQRGPHAASLGDLFGPYQLDIDCDEFRALDEATRRRYCSDVTGAADEVWFHEECAVWAPGLVAAGARLWGLAPAVWGARAARCQHCAGPGAALACAVRACRARAHLPCAVPPASSGPAAPAWILCDDFRALCPAHAEPPV